MNPLLAHQKLEQITLYWVPNNFQSAGLPTLTAKWFNAPEDVSDLKVTGYAQGRGTTQFLTYHGTDLVLRHYKRGGLVGRYLDDQFLYLGQAATRPVRELDLLIRMRSWGLPCPTPIAGSVERDGLVWRGDLLTTRIANAKDAHTFLREGTLGEREWRHIGATIASFHKLQVYHHDLNIHNIMLDTDGQAWLIDFDKCGIRRGEGWKSANLARLQRSLLKEQRRNQTYHYDATCWQALMHGYANHSSL
ncbi:3-deoxy-D-manno-octulosonic acid kinase [Alteromonas facilis]|uniref:3-deoxy-D-manno-octulosonic acid kinase n=1 Tax=Alteromonas facilis TaxID=2048004 RepID=UPI0013DC0401|nr:3-deoxy-D-manno-octulosonic acid kinase [Alteromonas facilis]